MYFQGGKNVESFGRCSLFLALFYGKEAKLCEKWIQMDTNDSDLARCGASGSVCEIKGLLAII